mmetsp:Transcript_41505/g.84852  ORF Transcript_41505/g.84852 Transcript_41505/m.84852 type:complete len:382 (-) Transcript_41505:710-1855(-)
MGPNDDFFTVLGLRVEVLTLTDAQTSSLPASGLQHLLTRCFNVFRGDHASTERSCAHLTPATCARGLATSAHPQSNPRLRILGTTLPVLRFVFHFGVFGPKHESLIEPRLARQRPSVAIALFDPFGSRGLRIAHFEVRDGGQHQLAVFEKQLVLLVRLHLDNELVELRLILDQNLAHLLLLVWVADENLKHVEGVLFYSPPLVPEQVHHELEISRLVDVLGHHTNVVPVKQHIQQHAKGLALRHVVVAFEELRVLGEEGVELLLQELGDHGLVVNQELAEGRERVGGNVKLRELHVLKHVLKTRILQQPLRQLLMPRALPQHQATTGRGRICRPVPVHKLPHNVEVVENVRDREPVFDVGGALQKVSEQEGHILAGLEVQI